jgi:hypothetical protein
MIQNYALPYIRCHRFRSSRQVIKDRQSKVRRKHCSKERDRKEDAEDRITKKRQSSKTRRKKSGDENHRRHSTDRENHRRHSTDRENHRHSIELENHRHSTELENHRHSTEHENHRHSTELENHRQSTEPENHRQSTELENHRHSTDFEEKHRQLAEHAGNSRHLEEPKNHRLSKDFGDRNDRLSAEKRTIVNASHPPSILKDPARRKSSTNRVSFSQSPAVIHIVDQTEDPDFWSGSQDHEDIPPPLEMIPRPIFLTDASCLEDLPDPELSNSFDQHRYNKLPTPPRCSTNGWKDSSISTALLDNSSTRELPAPMPNSSSNCLTRNLPSLVRQSPVQVFFQVFLQLKTIIYC